MYQISAKEKLNNTLFLSQFTEVSLSLTEENRDQEKSPGEHRFIFIDNYKNIFHTLWTTAVQLVISVVKAFEYTVQEDNLSRHCWEYSVLPWIHRVHIFSSNIFIQYIFRSASERLVMACWYDAPQPKIHSAKCFYSSGSRKKQNWSSHKIFDKNY